ncbi:MAG: hypothetical protein IPL08_13925 [Saprospiraceae bacterium]|nr:hypothetical protein [Saprospiraceae bacterium]
MAERNEVVEAPGSRSPVSCVISTLCYCAQSPNYFIHQVAERNEVEPKPRQLCDFDSVLLRSITQQHHTQQVAEHNAMKVAERNEVESKPRQLCDFDSVLLRSITQHPSKSKTEGG